MVLNTGSYGNLLNSKIRISITTRTNFRILKRFKDFWSKKINSKIIFATCTDWKSLWDFPFNLNSLIFDQRMGHVKI
jgi:hypothetical protein